MIFVALVYIGSQKVWLKVAKQDKKTGAITGELLAATEIFKKGSTVVIRPANVLSLKIVRSAAELSRYEKIEP